MFPVPRPTATRPGTRRILRVWSIGPVVGSPASTTQDQAIVAAGNYVSMRNLLEFVHDLMHGFVRMGGTHISFRDPFVFLLHSNVDRLFALWQLQPISPQRLDPNLVYGPESGDPALNGNVEPWSTGHSFDQFGSSTSRGRGTPPRTRASPRRTSIPRSSRRHATTPTSPGTCTWRRSTTRGGCGTPSASLAFGSPSVMSRARPVRRATSAR